MHWLPLLRTARPAFLLITPIQVFLAWAAATYAHRVVAFSDVVWVLIAALAAHISVNALNEYSDFHTGVDAHTQRTPFSGGSGALQHHPESANVVRYFAWAALGLVFVLGFYFVAVRGDWPLLLLGILGLAIVWNYTPRINRYPWLCLIAPGLGIGIVMVWGSELALSGNLSEAGIYAGLVSFFLASNLLLLNQLPDIAADQKAGRRTFPIVYGAQRSIQMAAVFFGLLIAVVITGICNDVLPRLSWISLLPLLWLPVLLHGLVQYAANAKQLVTYLGLNVILTLSVPILLGIAFLLR
ncbi:MAG: prenyltransferase [Gammaproteobacteria bacterium]